MADFTATIHAILEMSDVEAKLKDLENRNIKLNNIEIGELKIGNLNNFVKDINSKMGSAGKEASNSFSRGFNIKSAYNQILDLSSKTSNLFGKNDSGLREDNKLFTDLTKRYDTARKIIEEVNNLAERSGKSIGELSNKDLRRAFAPLFGLDSDAALKKFRMPVTSFMKSFSTEYKSLLEQINSTGTGGNVTFTNLEKNVNSLRKFVTTAEGMTGVKSQGVVKTARDIVDAFDQIKSPENKDGIDNFLQQFNYTDKNAIAKIQALKSELSELLSTVDSFDSKSAKSFIGNIGKLSSKITENGEKWTAAKFGSTSGAYYEYLSQVAKLQELQQQVSNGTITKSVASEQFKAITADAQRASDTIRSAGENTTAFSDRVSKSVKALTGMFTAYRMITRAVREIKEAAQTSIQLESSFAQLQIVTGATDRELANFKNTAVSLASELGRSVTDTTKSIETFSRLGYNLSESSVGAKYAAVLANTAATSTENATTGLTSIIKGFGMDMSEAEHVSDVLIQVGQKYAVSANELMEAFEKSGAALNATNTSFEKSAGLIAAANASVQNASTAGTALKTISARIRGSKTDLEDLGESTEGLANGFSKYAKEIKALTGFDIRVEGTTDTYKDLYDIMEGIAQVWDKLTDTQKARVSEILGGTRQLQVTSSIINNWKDAVGAYDDAMNSAGASSRANSIYMETTAAKIEQFRTAYQALASDFMDSDLLGRLVDIGSGFVRLADGLTKVTSKIGALAPIMGTLFSGMSLFNIAPLQYGMIKQNGKSKISLFGQTFADWGNVRKEYGTGGMFAGMIGSITGKAPYTSKDIQDLEKYNDILEKTKQVRADDEIGLANAEKARKDAVAQMSSASQAAVAAANGEAVAMDQVKASTVGATAATVAHTAAQFAMNAAIGLGIGALISGATKLIRMGVDLIKDKIAEAKKTVTEVGSELDNLVANATKVNSETSRLSNNVKDYIAQYKEYTKGVDEFGNRITLSDEDYQGFIDLNNQLAETFPSLDMGLDSEGNHILALSFNIDTLTESLNALVDAERRAANQEIIENLDGKEGVLAKYGSLKKKVDKERNDYTKVIKAFNDLDGFIDQKSIWVLDAADDLKQGDFYNYEKDAYGRFADRIIEMLNLNNGTLNIRPGTDLYSVLSNQIANVVKTNNIITKSAEGDYSIDWDKFINNTDFSNLIYICEQKIDGLDKYLATKGKEINSSLVALAQERDLYFGLDTKEQELVDKIVGNLDLEALFNNHEIKTKDDVAEYIDENIIGAIQGAKPETRAAFNELFSLSTSDLKATEWGSQASILINKILKDSSIDGNLSRKDLENLSGYNDVVETYMNTATKLTDLLSDVSSRGTLLDAFSPEQLQKAYSYALNYGISTLEQLKSALENETFETKIDFSVEAEGIQSLNAAMAESASAAGLTAESMSALKERYAELKGYDPSSLFERTTQGIHLNAGEVRKLEKEYAALNRSKLSTQLKDLQNQYISLSEKIAGTSSATERYNLKQQRSNILQRINEVQELATRYLGLTSAYQRWLDAQSQENTDLTPYSNVGTGYKQTKDLIGRGFYTAEEVTAYLDMVLHSKNRGDNNIVDFGKLSRNLGGTSYSFTDLFQLDDDGNITVDGLRNFVDAARELNSEAETYVTITKGKRGEDVFNLDFEGDKLASFSEKLGLSTEMVQIFLKALSQSGFKVNLDSFAGAFENLEDRVKEKLKQLSEGGNVDLTNRPVVDASILRDVGYKEAEDGYATVFTNTYTNKDKTVAVNFTPIITDDKGKYQDVLEPDALQKYAENVINGVHDDYLKLQVGAAFTGEDALKQAEKAANQIHELHDYYYLDEYEISQSALDVLKQLQEDGALPKELDLDIKLNKASVDAVQDQINKILKVTGRYTKGGRGGTSKYEWDKEGAVEAFTLLEELHKQKEELSAPVLFSVQFNEDNDTNAAYQFVEKMQKFKETYAELQTYIEVGDVKGQEEAKEKLDGLKEELDSFAEGNNIKINFEFGENTNEQIVEYLNGLGAADLIKIGINEEDITNLEEYEFSDKKVKVDLTGDETVDAWAATWMAKNLDKTITVTVNEVQGTTVSTGTAVVKSRMTGPQMSNGTAFDGGRWGIGSDGTALVGEIGQELVVRNGRFFTIGDNSAEMFRYKKDDIIFNADQTRQILRYGKITRGRMRGRSYAQGKAFDSARGFFYTDGRNTTSVGGSSSGSSSGSSYGSSYSSSDYDSGSDEEDTLEKVDWIEIAVKRIERAIDKLKTIATSAYKTISQKLSASADEITKVNEEIELQEKAYTRYLQEANSVGLSGDLAEKVRNGAIDIREYDEDTQKLINDYQQWYEKALDAADAIDELHESLAELYQDEFDAINDDFSSQIDQIKHKAEMLESGIDMTEEQGYFVSKRYYRALEQNSNRSIALMEKQLSELQTSLQRAMDSGEIEKYSEAWYDMVGSINDVEESIADARVELVKFANEARAIDWEVFDYRRGMVSKFSDTADFFVKMLGYKDLHNKDTGALTSEGLATIAMHGVQREAALSEAQKYADEINKLNKDIAKDPNNQKLLDQRDEWISKEEEAVLAAKEAEEAMVDLVREGIELEVEALKKLIDTYTDELDKAKDLYEYRKKIKEQSTTINVLQKQISSFEGDNSNEAMATVQKLRVELNKAQEELQESEYDQYIADQKALLGDLADDYEELLNKRLDNVDALISELITAVNTIGSLGGTLEVDGIKGEDGLLKVGQTLSSVVSNIHGFFTGEEFKKLIESKSITPVLTPEEKGQWRPGNAGDINMDNKITAADARLALRASAGLEELTPEQLERVDINGDGKVTAGDARWILRYSAQLDSALGGSSKTETALNNIEKSVDTMAGQSDAAAYNDITEGMKITSSLARKAFLVAAKQQPKSSLTEEEFILADANGDGTITAGEARRLLRIAAKLEEDKMKKYAGGGLVDYTGLAYLDGTKNKPEMVLSANDTQNFISLRDMLRAIKTKQVGLLNSSAYGLPLFTGLHGFGSYGTAGRDISAFGGRSGNGDVTVQIDSINIPIDHVEDYDDFVAQLQRDGKFEKFIHSVTVDRLAGGNVLAKNKYLR